MKQQQADDQARVARRPEPGYYDRLFDAIWNDRAWGTFTFTIKDGEVKALGLHQTFESVEDAVARMEKNRKT